MNEELLDFINLNYKNVKKKINTPIIKAEIDYFMNNIKIIFPIMRSEKKEVKYFNKKIKDKSMLILENDFKDLLSIIDNKNFKSIISTSNTIHKYCFFYNKKSVVFSIIESNIDYDFNYLGQSIKLEDLKYEIFKNIIKFDVKEFYKDPYKYNKNLNNVDMDILKILLI